jgi:alkylated DNA repair dioxygenase AlkB
VVESPHKTSFYARETDGYGDDKDWQEAAQYWYAYIAVSLLSFHVLHYVIRYNGRPTAPPKMFLPEMEEACHIVEKIVNEEISKRTRFSLEWPADEMNPWRANVAASNCYTGSKESVGFHSDQLTYLGPYPTIASLSLGGWAISASSGTLN